MKVPHYLKPPWGELHPGPFCVDYEGLANIMPGIADQDVSLRVPGVPIDGQVSRDELALLVGITKWIAPAKVFEFGTFDGSTTLNLAMNVPSATIYTIDLPEDNAKTGFPIDRINEALTPGGSKRRGSKRRFDGTEFYLTLSDNSVSPESPIQPIRMDSKEFDTSPYKGAIDVVFVDGAHTYEYCRSDSEKAFEMVSPNGIIIWHDYGGYTVFPGVTEYLNELARKQRCVLYWLLKKNTSLMTAMVMFCNGAQTPPLA